MLHVSVSSKRSWLVGGVFERATTNWAEGAPFRTSHCSSAAVAQRLQRCLRGRLFFKECARLGLNHSDGRLEGLLRSLLALHGVDALLEGRFAPGSPSPPEGSGITIAAGARETSARSPRSCVASRRCAARCFRRRRGSPRRRRRSCKILSMAM